MASAMQDAHTGPERLRILFILSALASSAGVTTRAAPLWGSVATDTKVEAHKHNSARIGVLVQGPSVKGLFRDAECLVWALARDPVRLNGRRPDALSVFYTSNYAMLDMAVGTGVRCLEDPARGKFCASANALKPGDSSVFEDHMVAAGTDVREWLQTVDVLVVFESVLRSVFAAAHKLGVRQKVLVLNIDWIEPNLLLALYSEIPGLQLWTKGNATQVAVSRLLHDHLSHHGVASAAARVEATVALVPWSIPDAILRQDSRTSYVMPAQTGGATISSAASAGPQPRHPQQEGAAGASQPVRFLFIAGMGGIGNRRGGDIVLEAFAHAGAQLQEIKANASIRLDFYSVRHPAMYDVPIPPHLLDLPGLRLHIGPLSRGQLSWALRLTPLNSAPAPPGRSIAFAQSPPISQQRSSASSAYLIAWQRPSTSQPAPLLDPSPDAASAAACHSRADRSPPHALYSLSCPLPAHVLGVMRWIGLPRHDPEFLRSGRMASPRRWLEMRRDRGWAHIRFWGHQHMLAALPRLASDVTLRGPHGCARRREADAVLYPSRWEGLGLSLLEVCIALRCGMLLSVVLREVSWGVVYPLETCWRDA